MTKPVTRRMVQDWILARVPVVCSICNFQIVLGDEVDWDHIAADIFDGPHVHDNIRPLHRACHRKIKTARDIKDNAKVKRLRGETKNKSGRRIPSKPFQKRTKPYMWPKRSMRHV